jgi:molybdopterin-guanine dinucleotide biosynthesis protein A
MSAPSTEQLLVGIFVGGESSRMGAPKGLLPAPGRAPARERRGPNLLERVLYISEMDLQLSTVLVGRRAEYDYLGRATVVDRAPGCGPLGGLVALLDHALGRNKSHVVAVACDLPYLGGDLLRKLAFYPGAAAVVCARAGEHYEPLFARYSVSCAPLMQQALDQRRLSLQPLLTELSAEILSVSPSERRELVDWDSPSDVLEGS